jgi:hypothetical protein
LTSEANITVAELPATLLDPHAVCQLPDEVVGVSELPEGVQSLVAQTPVTTAPVNDLPSVIETLVPEHVSPTPAAPAANSDGEGLGSILWNWWKSK